MGYSVYHSYDEKIHRCEMFFGNIVLPEFATPMATVGIDLPQLEAGATLTTEVINLSEQQRQENREQDDAYRTYHNKLALCEATFRRVRKWTQIALAEDADHFLRLGFMPLANTVKRRMVQASKCYQALLGDEAALTSLASYMLTRETIEAEVAELANLATLERKVLEEKGDAQMVVKQRDSKLDDLEGLYRKLAMIAELVFEDQPQILEKLGIIVKS